MNKEIPEISFAITKILANQVIATQDESSMTISFGTAVESLTNLFKEREKALLEELLVSHPNENCMMFYVLNRKLKEITSDNSGKET